MTVKFESKAAKPRTARGAKRPVAEAVDATIKHEEFVPMHDATVHKYPVLGAVANLVTTVLGVYGAIHFASYLGVAAALMSGSAFIGICVLVIGAVIGMLQAIAAGAVAGKYVATGQFLVDAAKAKDKVSGWFNRNKETAHV